MCFAGSFVRVQAPAQIVRLLGGRGTLRRELAAAAGLHAIGATEGAGRRERHRPAVRRAARPRRAFHRFRLAELLLPPCSHKWRKAISTWRSISWGDSWARRSLASCAAAADGGPFFRASRTVLSDNAANLRSAASLAKWIACWNCGSVTGVPLSSGLTAGCSPWIDGANEIQAPRSTIRRRSVRTSNVLHGSSRNVTPTRHVQSHINSAFLRLKITCDRWL